MAADRLHMIHEWLETRRAQAQFPVTFIFTIQFKVDYCIFRIQLILLKSYDEWPTQTRSRFNWIKFKAQPYA